ncbi:MAG: class I SAM-dependent methyltransferase [Steroidobacteraceae bacterium]
MPGTDFQPLAEAQPDIETSSSDYLARFSGHAGRFFLERQAAVLEQLLGEGSPGKVLDVGGGHAQLAPLLSARGWDVTVHGTSRVCEENLRNLHGVNDCSFLLGPLGPLPCTDREYDLVVAVRLLTHVDDWQGMVQELCRVSRRDLIIDFPVSIGLNGLSPILFPAKKLYERNTRAYRNFSMRELSDCLKKHGFQAVASSGQFVLPMVLHRMTRAAAPLRLLESIARLSGLTRRYGSPVLLRAVRR